MAFRAPMGPLPHPRVPDAHQKAARRLERARSERDAARFFASDDFDGERGENHEEVSANWVEQAEAEYLDALAIAQEFDVDVGGGSPPWVDRAPAADVSTEHQRRLALLKQTPKYNAAAKVRRAYLDAQALVKEFEV